MLLSFINKIKKKIQDMKTISKLCIGAEKYANLNGEEKPGAEHFMISAFDLPDNTARNVFKRLNIDPSGINEAIKRQHVEALSGVGLDQNPIDLGLETPEKIQSNLKLYDTQPSGQVLMQRLYQRNKIQNKSLIGAHVLESIASMEYGIAPRTLRAMGIDSIDLKKAIAAEYEI